MGDKVTAGGVQCPGEQLNIPYPTMVSVPAVIAS